MSDKVLQIGQMTMGPCTGSLPLVAEETFPHSQKTAQTPELPLVADTLNDVVAEYKRKHAGARVKSVSLRVKRSAGLAQKSLRECVGLTKG